MSAKSKRRRQTHRHPKPPLVAIGGATIADLLRSQECLALAVAEHEAHSLPGLTELRRQKYDAEQHIRALDPETFESHWAAWLRRDARLAHQADTVHPDCESCRLLTQHPEQVVEAA